MASIAETRVKPTRIPSSRVMGIQAPLQSRKRKPLATCIPSVVRIAPLRSGDAHDQIRKRSRLKRPLAVSTVLLVTRARHYRLRETQLFRFFQTLLSVCDGP